MTETNNGHKKPKVDIISNRRRKTKVRDRHMLEIYPF